WAKGLSGLEARAMEAEGRTAKFDLNLNVMDLPGERGLALSLEHRTQLFDATTAVRVLDHLERLLAGAMAAPHLPVSELSLLSEAERAHLLEWNDTGAAAIGEGCLHERFASAAERVPDRVALVFGEHRLSFGELRRRASALARLLQARGAGPEVRVGLGLERSAEMVVAMLGILQAGGAYIPLDPAYPRERLSFMLRDGEARLWLTRGDLLPGEGALDLAAVWTDLADLADLSEG